MSFKPSFEQGQDAIPGISWGGAIEQYIGDKYGDFSGKSSRSEFWKPYLIFLVGSFILYGAVFALILTTTLVTSTTTSGEFAADSEGAIGLTVASVLLVIGAVIALYTLIPGYSSLVRRLRDAGFHWAWILLSIIPGLGIVPLIIATLPAGTGSSDAGRADTGYPSPYGSATYPGNGTSTQAENYDLSAFYKKK